jgi:transposase
VRLLISPGQDHDATCAQALLEGLERRAIVIADKGYDADRIRALIRAQGAIPNIPNTSNRKKRFRWSKALYRHRNQVERFFNKLKQFRRIATRYDKLGAAFFAFVQLAAVRISLRAIESTACLVGWLCLECGAEPRSRRWGLHSAARRRAFWGPEESLSGFAWKTPTTARRRLPGRARNAV